MRSYLLAVLFLFFSMPGNFVFAQYEGEIRFSVYNPDRVSGETVQMNMTFTKNRIFIDSNVSMNVMAGLRAKGVLVRHDKQDFVMITNEDEGLKVAKSELKGLVDMINRVQGRRDTSAQKPFQWEERLLETGEQKSILGHNTYQFVLKGDKVGDYVSVWLTDEIKVDWGLLQEAWYAIGSKQLDEEVPIEMVMNEESFPLLVEAYENDEVVFRAESTAINDETFDRSKTVLPVNLKLMGLTDLMMNIFRQN